MIPDDNNIARYASPARINRDTEKPDGTAFRPRQGEEYLSVHCLDMLPGDDISSQIEYLKEDIPLNTKETGKIGIVNVGVMKKLVEAEENRKLTVTHEPVADPHEPRLNCDYHCGVRGIRYEDEVIADLIAKCVTECHSALNKKATDRLYSTLDP